MKMQQQNSGRRNFLRNTAAIVTGFSFMPKSGESKNYGPPENLNIIGPLKGYSTEIGTFVSMLNWMRNSIIRATQGLTQQELDFLYDEKSNTIGALLLHLAATEVIYQDLTFHNLKEFSAENEKKWGVAMSLGDEAQKKIKGNDLDYYLTNLQQVREVTLAEFKRRDDKWLGEVDPSFFGNQPTNNYCKWFHVCEHEANHRGQITVIKKRLSGGKSGE